MPIPIYLAMTAGEFSFSSRKPERLAWLACHLAPYDTGISNIPPRMPKDTLIILNDRIPWLRHDPKRIANQLNAFQYGAYLLDFQRNDTPAEFVRSLAASLSGKVCVALSWGKDTDLPICLPPVPPHLPIEEYLRPHLGRELWLEVALNRARLCINENGVREEQIAQVDTYPHFSEELACHYAIHINKNEAEFSFCRQKDDVPKLLELAKELGITRAVGLYQELK